MSTPENPSAFFELFKSLRAGYIHPRLSVTRSFRPGMRSTESMLTRSFVMSVRSTLNQLMEDMTLGTDGSLWSFL
jgi:hypothetical protein